MTSNYLEQCSINILSHEEMKKQNYFEIYFTPIRIVILKKSSENKTGENVGKRLYSVNYNYKTIL